MKSLSRLSWILALLVPFASAQQALLPDAPSSTPAYLNGQNEVVHSFNDSTIKLTPESRGPRKLLFLGGALAFAIAADRYDISETEKGLKAGVAVEGNTFLLGTDKPTAGQLYKRDLLMIGLTATPSTIAYIFRAPTCFYAGLTGPLVAGFKHISGGNQWKRLLEGQPVTGSEQIAPGSN